MVKLSHSILLFKNTGAENREKDAPDSLPLSGAFLTASIG